jgi:transcriptional regulator with XRE-family HTH domain
MPEEHRSQRQRLGRELRKLRKLAGLNGYQLAEHVGISQSKVSRIEAGSAVPTIREAEAWARAVGASDEVHANLIGMAEAALTEVETWRIALRHGLPNLQTDVRALEANARRISNFQPSLVPGLLQTAEYARRVFTLADVVGGQDYAGAVAARMSRQEILFDEDRRFEFLVTEGALRWRLGPPKLLLTQLDRVSYAQQRLAWPHTPGHRSDSGGFSWVRHLPGPGRQRGAFRPSGAHPRGTHG